MHTNLPDIVLLGLNHKTASVELRECLAFSSPEALEALQTIAAMPVVSEVVLISTCNRVEILLAAVDAAAAVDKVKGFLMAAKAPPGHQFENALYTLHADEAVGHIFRVAASLDSMMVGEPQILGQIKAAYLQATQNKTSGVLLNRLLHRAFFVAKRVRTETGIGDHAVSISYAAIELGRKIFGSLEGKKVLLIGAGEMAELAVEHLLRHRVADIMVANRTLERGIELARRFGGQAIAFEEIRTQLQRADIIISSTGSPDFVIRRSQVKGVLRSRRNRPIFFIDIAVPRDIDPRINTLANSYVYDIDDLKGIIDENVQDRQREAVKGARIVDEAVVAFGKWYHSLEVTPTVVALHRKLEQITRGELARTTQGLKHLSAGDVKALERMTAAMINKILHDPTLFLKQEGCRQDKSTHLDFTRKLFRLDD